MFKLHWVADPNKIKLKKPNLDMNIDELNSLNSNKVNNDRHITQESQDDMLLVPVDENKDGQMILYERSDNRIQEIRKN